jgi:hypothetical protein
MSRPSKTPGICRIDQPSHRTHGFFVRLQRQGVVHNAFFADKSLGGRSEALRAAQKYYRKLERKYLPMTRKSWAQLLRRQGKSGIIGVRQIVVGRGRRRRVYWAATWSPKPYVVRRRQFSVNRYGPRKAKLMAVQARQAGLRSMK